VLDVFRSPDFPRPGLALLSIKWESFASRVDSHEQQKTYPELFKSMNKNGKGEYLLKCSLYRICKLPRVGDCIRYQSRLPAITNEIDFGNFSFKAVE
jgi:hypothetical protein